MLILGFDTSNAYSSLSISSGNKIIYAKKEERANTQAERLLPMIEEALAYTKLSYNELTHIAVSAGPGSFTGIRIALAAAKGILLAAPHLKPICVNNFQMINFRIRQQSINFDYAITTVDAYRGQLYLQIFTKAGEYEEPILISTQDAKELILKLKGTKVLAGSGLHHLYNVTKNPEPEIMMLVRFAYPDARFVCLVAHQQIVQHKTNPNIEPLYIRPPDAKLPK